MTKQKEVKTALEIWFNCQLSLTRRGEVKDLIMQRCNISESTFYRRLKEPYQYNDIERAYIASLFGSEVPALFPEYPFPA